MTNPTDRESGVMRVAISGSAYGRTYALTKQIADKIIDWFSDSPLSRVEFLVCDSEYKNKFDKLTAENARMKETLSYLPRVPTQPYEKEMAQELFRLRAALEKIANVDFRGNRSSESVIAFEALKNEGGSV